MLEESVGYTVFDGGAALSTDPMLVEVGLRNLERYCVHAELERTEVSTGGVAEELGSEQVAEDEGADPLHRTSQPPQIPSLLPHPPAVIPRSGYRWRRPSSASPTPLAAPSKYAPPTLSCELLFFLSDLAFALSSFCFCSSSLCALRCSFVASFSSFFFCAAAAVVSF
jgi:hypothetical protein